MARNRIVSLVSAAAFALALPFAAHAADDRPTESITFSFGKLDVHWEFTVVQTGELFRPTFDDAQTELTLFSGGVEVGSALVKSGAAPFDVSGGFATHEIEVSGDPYKQQIDVVSISFGPSTATFDDGRALETRTTVPATSLGHELGHSFGLYHAQTERAAGSLGRDLLLGGSGADL